MLRKLWKDEEGQGMVEYGLIIGLVAVVLIGVLVAMRGGLATLFGKVQTAVENPGAAQ
ncbi:MAG TPA: Flp family type IVb pilin [Bacillota bacterium]|nr:Flp family type IVb pilin [Bacillota bacterium]